MNEKMIDSKNIRLGRLTYFDTVHNGSAVPPVGAYVFMVKDGLYYNPFDLTMDLPVYDRTPYTNTTKNGEDFGTKIVNVQGEVTDGLCVVLEKIDVGEYFGKEQMNLNMLKECILNSDSFFIDRIKLFEQEKNEQGILKMFSKKERKLASKVAEDKMKLEKLLIFLDECNSEKEIHHTR